MRGFVPLIAATVCMLLPASWGRAEPPRPPWKSAQYSHIADDEPLPTLLREFAADQGVSIVVSEKVQGKVRGRFGPTPPEQYLETVTRQNGLIWYFDGSAIFVYRGDELESEILQLRRIKPQAILDALRDLDVPADRGVFRVAKDGNLIHVIGAPRFVAMVRNIGARLEGSAVRKAAVGLSVKVFPLRYSWAEDQNVAFRESALTVPGVATLLRNLVGLSGRGPQGSGTRKNPAALPTLAGQGLASIGDYPKRSPFEQFVNRPPAKEAEAANPPVQPQDPQQQPQSVALETDQGLVPSIQAEPRLNAVVIQDTPDRFPVYEALIASLDVPVGLVEIEAMIIDVSSNKNFSLGLPIAVNGKDSSIGLRVNPTDQANLAFTLVNGGVQQLLVQLQALAAQGHAKVVARPAVLTLDNIEAHLESTQTIFVRIPGTFANDLFNIVVGTSLRVTPHIVDDGGQRKVKLQVRIEDGTPLNATVDSIPTIQRNSINTQAVLAEDQSLFIGGLARDDRNLQERGVPWLKDVPRVGALFRTTVSTVTKTERYVLLTPRIVGLDPPAGIGPWQMPVGGASDGPRIPMGDCPPSSVLPTAPSLPAPSTIHWDTLDVPGSPKPPTEPIRTTPQPFAPPIQPHAAPQVSVKTPTAMKSDAAPPPTKAPRAQPAARATEKLSRAPVENAWPETPFAIAKDFPEGAFAIPTAKASKPDAASAPRVSDEPANDGWRATNYWTKRTADKSKSDRR